MEREFSELLINFPANGENPFEYENDDKPYLLWLTNRNIPCSKLFSEKIPNSRSIESLLKGEDKIPVTLQPGYTALEMYERVFCLYMGDISYKDIWNGNLQDQVKYVKNGIKESDLVADNLIFLYKDDDGVKITTATWKWHPKLIKDLTGKSKYSIKDARIIINSMRSGADNVYACIGVQRIWCEDWH